MLENNVCEYGPDIVLGMPKGQTIEMNNTIFENITIVDEYDPSGTQKLKAEDIIEEIKKIPKNIRKYISSIVLSPFTHPYQELFNKRMGREAKAFASADYERRQITIYAVPEERSCLKERLAKHFTLSHEAGHIIDGAILDPVMGFFAYNPRWVKAICEDSKIRRIRQDCHYF